MSIDIADAFKGGFDDLASPKGLTMAGLLIVFGVFNQVVGQTFSVSVLQTMFRRLDIPARTAQRALSGQSTALGIRGIPLPAAVVLWLLFVVLLAPIVQLIVIRTFGSDSTDPLPMDDITANFGGTLLNYVLASIIVAIAVVVGLVFLVIPGLIVALVLFFVQQRVALSGDSAIEAVGNSIDIVKENVLEVVVIAVGLFVINAAIGFIVGIPIGVVGSVVAVLAPILRSVLQGFLGAFSTAVVVNAYLQVESASALGSSGGATTGYTPE